MSVFLVAPGDGSMPWLRRLELGWPGAPPWPPPPSTSVDESVALLYQGAIAHTLAWAERQGPIALLTALREGEGEGDVVVVHVTIEKGADQPDTQNLIEASTRFAASVLASSGEPGVIVDLPALAGLDDALGGVGSPVPAAAGRARRRMAGADLTAPGPRADDIVSRLRRRLRP